MNELRMTAAVSDELRNHLLGEVESCAVLYTSEASDGARRCLIVSEVEYPTDADYEEQTRMSAQLTPRFVARVVQTARRSNRGLAFVHTHPGTTAPHFSLVDDAGEKALAGLLAHRIPDSLHAALVLSLGGTCARELASQTMLRVVSVGARRDVLFEPEQSSSDVVERFDRQVRAFGNEAQRGLARLRVGIVGLGGTGSVVAQQLAYLGVRDFVLLDPDVIEETNLNRVVGAGSDDMGIDKVKVAERTICRVAPDARVDLHVGDITRTRFARPFLTTDVVFACTDSHGSRAVLQQMAYQYLIPCIDMGSVIIAKEGEIQGVYGRAQLLSPGLPCLTCGHVLDSNEVRRDMMSEAERKLDPYIVGSREPAPAVISINSTVASLATTMFMAVCMGLPSKARHLIYDGLKGSVREVATKQTPDCYICSTIGYLGCGSTAPLLGRLD